MPLKTGSHFQGPVMVEAVELSATRAGKPYTTLRVRLPNGEDQPARFWDGHLTELTAGDVIFVEGTVDEWSGRPQIKMISWRAAQPGEVPAADFLPHSPFAPEERLTQLLDLVARSCRGPERLLAEHLLNLHRAEFLAAPGGVTMHHNTLGGLVEHTLAVTRLALNHYFAYQKLGYDVSRLNLSVMIAGAAVHDIGKVREYSYARAIDYDELNVLAQHIVLGHEMVAAARRELQLELTDSLRLLEHIVLSHHGTLEFGSPVEPLTLEAYIVHRADDFDVNYFVAEEVLRLHADVPGRLTGRDGRLWNNKRRLWRPGTGSGPTNE